MVTLHPRTRLDSFVEGALTPASRERVAAHLEHCAECRREVEQRERVHRAASSLQYGTGRDGSAPVLEAASGVAGWKVVAGLGALGLATLGVLGAAWMAGAPEDGEAGQAGDETALVPAAALEPSDRPDAAGSTDSGTHDAGPSGTAVPSGSAAAPDDGGAATDGRGAVLTPAGLDAGGDGADGAGESGGAPELTGYLTLGAEMVADLRQRGWNIPSLNPLGVPHHSTGWRMGEGVAEVVVSMGSEDSYLLLHECRRIEGQAAPDGQDGQDGQDGPDAVDAAVPGQAAPDAALPEAAADDEAAPVLDPVECPAPGAASTAEPAEPAESADVQRRTLPVGVDLTVRQASDGTWTATAATAGASYVLRSDLPAAHADRVMSLVVVSERSRVLLGDSPERPADRIARGFERLLPWTDPLGEERR